jgi:hypothetical protein
MKWKGVLWKSMVPMIKARILKSPVRDSSQAWSGGVGGVGGRSADHNLGGVNLTMPAPRRRNHPPS